MVNFLKKKFNENNGLFSFPINDSKTKKVTDFYKVTPFPNYKDDETNQSIIEKGNRNLFAQQFKKFIGHNKNVLEVGCGTGQLSIYFAIGTNNEIIAFDPTIESLNLAKIQKAPMLFVIENNLFASHMHISSRQPSDMTSRFAIANNIPHKLVDGNDVVAVSKASKELIDDMRAGKGPALIELVTYRWYGHVDWRVDVDVGVERSLDDIENWKKRDPILRLSKSMIKAKIWTMEQEKILNNKIDKEIKIAWEKAMNDSYPSSDATLKYVYSQENNEK